MHGTQNIGRQGDEPSPICEALPSTQLHKIVNQGAGGGGQNTATKVENGLSTANRVYQKLATSMYRALDRNTNIYAQRLVVLFRESCFALAE